MPIEKRKKIDQIQIVLQDDSEPVIQVREKTTVIDEDGSEIASSFHRSSYSWRDDWSAADQRVKNLCESYIRPIQAQAKAKDEARERDRMNGGATQ